MFRNKFDETRMLVRYKAKLVATGYNKEEGIDYDKIFAHVARLEAIGMLLPLVTFPAYSYIKWI